MIEQEIIDRVCVLIYHEQKKTITGSFDEPFWYELDERVKNEYRILVRSAIEDGDHELLRVHQPERADTITLPESEFSEEDIPEGHPDFIKEDVS